MKKHSIMLFVFFFGLNNSFAQENKLPLDFDSYCLYANINDVIATEQYLKYDFSNALIPDKDPYNQFLGVIGSEYQRLYIVFNEIKKNKNDPKIYEVKGYSKVKGNKNDFIGKLIVEKIYAAEGGFILGDDDQVEAESKAGVTIFAKYEFLEDKNQKFSGKFQGEMWLGGYIDMNDNFIYGESYSSCPGFRNNQYVGTWQGYNKSKTKIANWGQHQIPGIDPKDDPTGGGTKCGGVSVDPKYNSRGWSQEEQPPKC